MSELSVDFAIVGLSSLLSIHPYYLQSILSHTKGRCCSNYEVHDCGCIDSKQGPVCSAGMYDSIATASMIVICLPIWAFWGLVTYRLLAAEKSSTNRGSQSKPDHPPMRMIFA